jgi:hypothetical protein
LFIQERAHRCQFDGMRVGNPRRDEWQLWRKVTHPAVPPPDGVGVLDKPNLHQFSARTITGCVSRITLSKSLRHEDDLR